MSDLVFDNGVVRYDLSLPEDRYGAAELAIVALDNYRHALSVILEKEKARTNPNQAYLRDLQKAYDNARALKGKLSGDDVDTLMYVLREILPLSNILMAAARSEEGRAIPHEQAA